MNGFLIIIIIMACSPYIVVPILIRRNQIFTFKQNVRPIINGFLPKTVEKFFNDSFDDIKPFGFEHRIDAISLDYGPNLRVYLRLYVAPSRSMIAIATSLLPDGERSMPRNFMEFSSRFLDGREVSTHNSDLFGAPIEHKKKTVFTLPSNTKTAVLFLIHQNMLNRLNLLDKAKLIPDAGHEFNFLVQSFQDELARQASLGCLYADRANQCYRPTWAGAFLIGWYSMWPISPIRRILQKIKARIRIRALGSIDILDAG